MRPSITNTRTILRAYCLYREQGGSRPGAGRLASFEDWADLVRQAICWLAQQPRKMCDNSSDMYPRLVDPMIAVNEAVTADPTRTLEARLLHAWAAEIGIGPGRAHSLTVKEVLQHAAWRPLRRRTVSKQTTIAPNHCTTCWSRSPGTRLPG